MEIGQRCHISIRLFILAFPLLLCVSFVNCSAQQTENLSRLSVRNIHLGCRPADFVVDVGTKWCIDSIRVNGRVYSVPAQTKYRQKEGKQWSSFTAEWIRICYYSSLQIRVMVNTELKEFLRDRTNSFCVYVNWGEQNDSVVGIVDPLREGGEWWPVVTTYDVNFDKIGGIERVRTDRFCVRFSSVQIEGREIEISNQDNINLLKNLALKKSFGWLEVEISGKDITLIASPNENDKERNFTLEFQRGYSTIRIVGSQR